MDTVWLQIVSESSLFLYLLPSPHFVIIPRSERTCIDRAMGTMFAQSAWEPLFEHLLIITKTN